MASFKSVLGKGVAWVRSLRLVSHIRGRGCCFIFRKSHVYAAEASQIELKGNLLFGTCYRGYSGRSSIMTLGINSRIEVTGRFEFYYGADVQVFDGGVLTLGESFINSDCKIRCHRSISIGNGCAISHDFTVMDSNAHELNGSRDASPVVIGDHVWIGTRVTVLPGVSIGDGAVVAAGALVVNDVPAGSLVGGVPARILKDRVEWKA